MPEHAQLNWLLDSLTPMGWLNRMTQFKDKAGKNRDAVPLGLYAYPVLQAADVLIYQATHVPVGEDQKQHIELARDIAGAFNRRYGQDFFTLPEPIIQGEGARIMSLRDGAKKMSKSDESDYSRINLTDDADAIALKIRKAKTDAEPLPGDWAALAARPEAANLVTIYATLADRSRDSVIAEFAGRNFAQFKPALADLAVAALAPLSARMTELTNDPGRARPVCSAAAPRGPAPSPRRFWDRSGRSWASGSRRINHCHPLTDYGNSFRMTRTTTFLLWRAFDDSAATPPYYKTEEGIILDFGRPPGGAGGTQVETDRGPVTLPIETEEFAAMLRAAPDPGTIDARSIDRLSARIERSPAAGPRGPAFEARSPGPTPGH